MPWLAVITGSVVLLTVAAIIAFNALMLLAVWQNGQGKGSPILETSIGYGVHPSPWQSTCR